MKKGQNEGIREYAARYFDMMNEVEECPSHVAVISFKTGLPRSSELFWDLAKCPPRSVQELLLKVDEAVRLEDELGVGIYSRSGYSPAVGGRKSEPDKGKSSGGGQNVGGSSSGDAKNKQNRRVNSIFAVPVWKVFKAVKDKHFFRWPEKLGGDPNRRNPDLNCAYHKAHGHRTETCRQLIKHLEELAAAGHLNEFLKSQGNNAVNAAAGEDNEQTEAQQNLGTIDMIHGSLSLEHLTREEMDLQLSLVASIRDAGPSGSQAKRTADGAVKSTGITFTDKDLEGVSLPHSDPLVVTVQIGDKNWVKRSMVDPGATMDVMYLPCFKKLGFKDSALQPVKGQLVGFGGQWTMPRGKITLPVTAKGVRVPVTFMVVDAPSPHNCILGTNWIHALRAVPSTFHQMIRFPSAEGVQTLRGDQCKSRECVFAALMGWNLEPKKVPVQKKKESAAAEVPESSDKGKAQIPPEQTEASVEASSLQ